MSSSEKPRVLILGGLGFIGRNLVTYLVKNELTSKIRVIDKQLVKTANLSAEETEIMATDGVEVKQGNLVNDKSIEKSFADEEGTWDIVINLAAETKYSQPEETYQEKVVDLSRKVAAEAAKIEGLKRYIELSTAQVYSGDSKKKINTEAEGKIDPWTMQATYSLQAEEAVLAIEGLPVIILRPAIVYGPGDMMGLMPRCVCGAVYNALGEKMKFLWGSDMRMNTVHVSDVCRAIWHLTEKGDVGAVYNLADKADTSQQSINDILEKIFNIKTGFQGTIASNAAKLNMDMTTEYINDKHLKPWGDLCKAAGITNTPLTPYLDKELLYNKSLYVDGSFIESTGFEYQVPEPTVDLVMESINYFVDMGLFPPQ